MTRIQPIPAALIVVLFAANAVAQSDGATQLDDNVRWAATARQSDLPTAIKLQPVSASSYEGENIVVQSFQVDYSISEHFIDRTTQRAYRYLSEDGVRDHGNLRAYFNAATDNVEIQYALVVDSGGKTHLVEPETVQILTSDSSNVFSDSKVVLLPMASLDVGSTAIVVDTVRSKREGRVAPWGAYIYEQFGVPLEHFSIRVSWSAPELQPEWNSVNENVSCTESSEMSVTCTATDIPAYARDSSVYYDDIIPQFLVAEKFDWEGIKAWYHELFARALSSDPAIVAMSNQLSDGLEDETEILKAIHRFVATQVRYVGLEHGDFAFVPHRSDETLQRRYGDCKDKTALLIDLLRQQGIEMGPVLVATERRDPDKLLVPSGQYFDHLIVCGNLSSGREYCLDSTDPYSGIEPLSNWIQGAVALPVTRDGGPTVLPADEFRWSINEDLDLEITDGGHVRESSSIGYSGAYGSWVRGMLSSMDSLELQEWAVDDYQRTVSDMVEPDFRFSGIDAINEDLTVSWETEYSNLVSGDEPVVYAEKTPWLDQMLSFFSTENDDFSYRFPGLKYDAEVTIDLHNKWRLDLTGPDIDIQSSFGRFQRTHEVNDQTVTITTTMTAPAVIVGVTNLDRFRKFFEIVQAENIMRIEAGLR